MTENKDLKLIKQLLDNAEANIRQARSLIFAEELTKRFEVVHDSDDHTIVEGVFDGEFMVATNQQKYPVPPNYASKSKLVPGDVLKLTILPDGSFLFKQIAPIKRKKAIGILEDGGKGRFLVDVEGTKYQLLLASVTYFKAVPGDRLTVILPADVPSDWAAVENVIEKEGVTHGN